MHSPPTPPTAAARRSWTAVAFALVLAIGLVVPGVVPGSSGTAAAVACGSTDAALNRPATASSTEGGAFAASAAVDGDTGTRWSSAFADPQWIQVDLGSSQDICQVVLNWEAAYATAFEIQVSGNGSDWTTVYSTTNGTGGTQTLDVDGTGRYVRMHGTARATQYGYSLWSFAVHTGGGGGGDLPGGGDLGPNVLVFDDSMPDSEIQARVDAVFAEQESSQFGTGRYTLAFKPGDYNVNVDVGFYTSVIGLGQNPGDVTLNGVTVDAGWFGGNATQNFWRSVENLTITPPPGTNRWAVSQAAPFRRIHVKGNLNLAPSGYGWASGGYIADSKIDGQVQPYSQQQWLTRDSEIGGNLNGVWNQVFSGVEGAPATGFPDPPYTTLQTSPVTREKPFLYVDSSGSYRVFVPALRHDSRGTTWSDGSTPGSSIPLSDFYVAEPGDSAATINAALDQGLNLMFTPGIYHVDQTIDVTRPGTVVLGVGYPTIIPDGGAVPMKVADVDGVKLAGLLFDAGPVNSPILLEVGTSGGNADHSDDPTSLQDVFFRIGGAGPGKASKSLVVHSDDTLLDHIWAWRGDHGAGIGWDVNTAANGVIVNGDDVTAYGLFVEHYQEYQLIWNGERGKVVFFQNEMPYDPPSEEAWRPGQAGGYAAYKVADHVTAHEAWGLGSYCYFNVNPSIVAARGFEAPTRPGVSFHSLSTVSLGGHGTISHVINGTGSEASGTDTVPATVVSYP